MSDRATLSAVVLGTVDYGESDRVVTLFSREQGRLSAFARGARVSRRRFGGALEPYTLLSAVLKGRGGSGLPVLESVSVDRAFGAIRGDLARIACAGYACELCRELLRDGEAHPDLFALLVEYLEGLNEAPATPTALRALELGALREAGLMPRLTVCARCGGSPEPGSTGRVAFDVKHGGVLCASCAMAGPVAATLDWETAMALSALQAGGLAAARDRPLSAHAGAEARAALTRFVEHHLGKQLKSRRFLDEVGAVLGQ